MHEKAYWKNATFITLTYNEENVPDNYSLDKAEFTKFWKRLRKSLHPRKIKYYGCGEYGENFGRPHYHAIIFGLQPCQCSTSIKPDEYCSCKDRMKVMDAWDMGGVPRLGTVTLKSCRYTADYISKALSSATKTLEGTREKPFAVMSQGIGKRFIYDNWDALIRDQKITIHGNPIGIPRYYAKKLGIALKRAIRKEPDEIPLHKRSAVFTGNMPEWLPDLEKHRIQKENDAKARLDMFKKGNGKAL